MLFIYVYTYNTMSMYMNFNCTVAVLFNTEFRLKCIYFFGIEGV